MTSASNERRDSIRSDRQQLESELRSRGCTIRGNSTTCPAHDDSNPSASIKQGDDGAWRVYCYVPTCGFKGDVFDVRALNGGPSVADQLRELGDHPARSLTPAADEKRTFATIDDLKAAYPKADEFNVYTCPRTGKVDLVTIRVPTWDRKHDRLGKRFIQAHQRGDGRFVEQAPAGPLPLFNRTRIKDASIVVVVEGEKCVRALAKINMPATTSPGGSNGARKADWTPLRGKKCYLWHDNDAAGRKYMSDVAEILAGLDCELWTIDPAAAGLDGDGQDVADFLDAIRDKTDAEKWNAVDCVLTSAKRISQASELDDYFAECVAGKNLDVPFEFHELSRLTNALIPGTVTLLCGDAGDGKSYFLLQQLLHWHQAGVPVAVFFLEENRRYWLQRTLALLSGQPGVMLPRWIHEHAAEAQSIKAEYAKFIDSFATRISDAPNDPPKHADMLAWIKQRAEAGSRIIAIDPVTLATTSDKPWLDDLQFMVKAKTLARECGFSLILVTHPRITKKGGNILDNLAGGASYPRFAQTVIWVRRHRPEWSVTVASTCGPYTRDINRSIHVAKARNGIGTGWDIAYDFDPATVRFVERGVVIGEGKE
jgi:KaiC/GvpD/RAD55 family RecA-like ATPase